LLLYLEVDKSENSVVKIIFNAKFIALEAHKKVQELVVFKPQISRGKRFRIHYLILFQRFYDEGRSKLSSMIEAWGLFVKVVMTIDFFKKET
jgi:hypothetical protein